MTIDDWFISVDCVKALYPYYDDRKLPMYTAIIGDLYWVKSQCIDFFIKLCLANMKNYNEGILVWICNEQERIYDSLGGKSTVNRYFLREFYYDLITENDIKYYGV